MASFLTANGGAEEPVEGLESLRRLVLEKRIPEPEAARIESDLRAPDSLSKALGLTRLGAALLSGDRAPEAAQLLGRALEIRKSQLPADDPRLAESLNNLASALLRQGDLTRARELLERAAEIREKAPGRRNLDSTLINLAGVDWSLGDLVAARRHGARALELARAGTDPARRWKALNVLALVLQALGELDASVSNFEEALDILEKEGSTASFDAARVSLNLGLALDEIGNQKGARERLEKALGRLRESPLQARREIAACRNHLAWLDHREGRIEQARAGYQEAVRLREEALGTDHPDLGWTLANLGLLELESGHPNLALELHERALAIRERSLGPQHPLVVQTLSDLARTRAARGELDQALELALQAEQASMADVRLIARSLPERQALVYLSRRSDLARRTKALDVALDIASSRSDDASLRAVLDALIRSRAVVLDEVWARRRRVQKSSDPETERLEKSLASARERQAYLRVRGPSERGIDAHRAILEAARKEAESLETQLAERTAPEAASRSPGLAEVEAALPDGTALVSFVRHTAASGGGATLSEERYSAFVLRKGTAPRLVPLGPAKRMEPLAQSWAREAARGGAVPEKDLREAEQSCRLAGRALRAAVWDPLASALAGAGRILVVPDGALHLVLLDALPDGPSGYLAESARIESLSAERDLARGVESENVGRGLLAIGGPEFGKLDGKRGAVSGHFFGPLPATLTEARTVAQLWSSPSRKRGAPAETSTLLSLETASEANVRAQATGRRVLHFATHGFFLGEGSTGADALPGRRGIGRIVPLGKPSFEPWLGLSGLALAGANLRDERTSGDEDGVLTAEEVAGLDLGGVELVALSACDTAKGEIRAGEGVLGLRRSFLVAGARSLVMSAWEVGDVETERWMRGFYLKWLEGGVTAPVAAREVSLEILRERRVAGLSTHPFFWGSFLAVDGRP